MSLEESNKILFTKRQKIVKAKLSTLNVGQFGFKGKRPKTPEAEDENKLPQDKPKRKDSLPLRLNSRSGIRSKLSGVNLRIRHGHSEETSDSDEDHPKSPKKRKTTQLDSIDEDTKVVLKPTLTKQ